MARGIVVPDQTQGQGGRRCGNTLPRKAIKEQRIIVKKSEMKDDELVVSLNYPCTATYKKMKNLLMCRGLFAKHHNYEFNIPEVFGPDSTSVRPRFFLPLFLLEAGFTIPLLDFIRDVLYDFNVAPGQLTSLSLWLLVS
ncbi:hypothetical protein PVK06_007676 [Gossypium arboreum]|uniref:Uncharacterized protein n=1 Tax=Gossypium arboreum TaxID=29729 RepID=A0ABR0QI01_GOSAR|nr:hypothetical protein PVK06_007676 [Gossypium arboreum]